MQPVIASLSGMSREAIVSSIRKLNGSWPQTPDVLSGSACSAPQVAMGGNGTVVAVWHDESLCVYSASKAIDGSWNLPAQVIGEAGLFPQVAVDASGNALAVWYGFAAKTTLQFASCPVSGKLDSSCSSCQEQRLTPSCFRYKNRI